MVPVEKAPRIALVHDFLFTYGGAERVLAEFHTLFPEAPIYTAFANPEIVSKYFPKAQIITSSLQKNPLRRWPALMLTGMPGAIESFNLKDYDIVLSSSGAFSHGCITGADTTHICYCHTPMRYAWDWHHEYLAERGINGTLPLLMARGTLAKLRLWDVVSAKRVDHWLTNSYTVQARITKYYRQPAVVIHPPVADSAFTYPLVPKEQREAYFVTASRLTPNKRIDLIIQACAKEGLPLKILGEGTDRERLSTLARKCGANVSFTGYVPEKQKYHLIAAAKAFIFAAEDDFGLAPAEALALGTPVIAYAAGGILDVLTPGSNGEIFPEASAESLATALRSFTFPGNPQTIRESVVNLSGAAFQTAIRKVVNHV